MSFYNEMTMDHIRGDCCDTSDCCRPVWNKSPRGLGFCSLYLNQQKLRETGTTVGRAQFNLGIVP